jgi:hypothetical protein
MDECSVSLPSATHAIYAPPVVLKATVRNGRIVVDEPTNLPEGTVLSLVVDHPDHDDMSPEEKAALDAALTRSWAQIQTGQAIPIEQVLEKMRKLRTE